MGKATITIPVELEGMEAVRQSAAQVAQLVETLKEARTLTDALASDMEKLQPKAPKVDSGEINEKQLWECVARFFAAAHESWCTQKPVDSNLICTNCAYLQNCADGSPIWYWITANRILQEKIGIGCQIARSFKDFDE